MVYRITFCWALLLQAVLLSGQYTPLTLEKIYRQHLFYPSSIESIRSMADGEHYTVFESGRYIVSYDYKTGKDKKVLFDAQKPGTGISGHISDYAFSNDENKLLLTSEVTRIYRHSFQARYWICDLQTGKALPLCDSGKQQLATFSPDGTKIAFVKENNLFYKNLNDQSITQITTDGRFNHIINGAPDWVYEEEFGFSQAYCWSPDSRSIAFYRFDESRVKEFDMMLYNNLYPNVSRFKYPKAGEDNSLVSILVYDIASGSTQHMDTGSETDQYIPRIKWTMLPGKLGIIRLNRLQNKVDVLIAETTTGKSTVLYTEQNKQYLSRIDDNYLIFTADGQQFLILSPRSGYYHYYLYNMQGELLGPVTQGNWEVADVLAIDHVNHILYYTSNESAVINKDVCGVHFDGSDNIRFPSRIGTNRAKISANFTWYINEWSDANNPPCYTLHNKSGKLIRTLEDNAELSQRIREHGFTKKEFMRIPVGDDLELYAYIIKPPDFDSTRQYPLFMSVYGGPESQDVVNKWDIGLAWQQMLAQQGIVVACVDNRGTDGRGEAFRKSTYMQLGKLETEDQVNAARYFGRLSWIDENRIGIWGWSYGGYMSLLCLTRGADVFSMGISVAPVTNWRFYDNIYTERYMRKPQDNPNGYDDNSPINHAGKLKGNLLLVHGTADDNVHLQNSVEMSEQLIQENRQFQQFFYPNKNHSIYGGNTRYHLYSMITGFIFETLTPGD